MNENKVIELEQKASSLLGFSMLFAVAGLGFMLVSLRGGTVYALIAIALLAFGVLLLSKSFDYNNQAHEVFLQVGHIHAEGCEDRGPIVVKDTKIRYVYTGIGHWAVVGSWTPVVDSEITECSYCKSKTRFDRGKPPQLGVEA